MSGFSSDAEAGPSRTRTQGTHSPVDPPRPFLRLDVDLVMVDINLGNLHLEVIGKEPDGFSHCAEAGTARRLKQRGRGRRACKEQIGASDGRSHTSHVIKVTTINASLAGVYV